MDGFLEKRPGGANAQQLLALFGGADGGFRLQAALQVNIPFEEELVPVRRSAQPLWGLGSCFQGREAVFRCASDSNARHGLSHKFCQTCSMLFESLHRHML